MTDNAKLIAQARRELLTSPDFALAYKLIVALEAAEAEREKREKWYEHVVSSWKAEEEDWKDENGRLLEALGEVVKQFNLWSEDANDGTYALYESDGLMVACVNARDALGGGQR